MQNVYVPSKNITIGFPDSLDNNDIDTILRNRYDSLPSKPVEEPAQQDVQPERTPITGLGLLKSAKAGYSASDIELIRQDPNLPLPGKPVNIFKKEEYTYRPDNYIPKNIPERLAYQMGMLAGDLPFYIGGYLGGAAAGSVGGPWGIATGSAAGAFALPSAIREHYMQAIENGSVNNFQEFWDRTLAVGKEAGKAGLTGVAVAAGGGFVGAGLRVAGAPAIISGAGKLAAEAGALWAVPPALEGKVPDSGSFIEVAAALVGLKLAGFAAGRLRGIYAERGTNPYAVQEYILKNDRDFKVHTMGAKETNKTSYVDDLFNKYQDIVDAEWVEVNGGLPKGEGLGRLKPKGFKTEVDKILEDSSREKFKAQEIERLSRPKEVRYLPEQTESGIRYKATGFDVKPVTNIKPPTTMEFKKWFKGSKIVDTEGKPLVAYHGTTSDFSSFDASKIGKIDEGWYGEGFYFTPNPSYAGNYAEVSEGGNVMPVYLNIKNPFHHKGGTDITVEIQSKIGGDDAKKLVELNRGWEFNKDVAKGISKILKDNGYDGIITTITYNPDNLIKGRYNGDWINELTVFDPKQIKSATGNSGKFNPESADITDRIPTQPITAAFKLRSGELVETGSVHIMPSGVDMDDIIDSGFLIKESGEYISKKDIENGDAVASQKLLNAADGLINGESGFIYLPTKEEFDSAVERIKEPFVKAWDNIVKTFDVESGFIRLNAPKTGFAAKNMYSMQSWYETDAIKKAKQVARTLEYSPNLMSKAVLVAEDPQLLNSLPRDEREKVKAAVDIWNNHAKQALELLQSKGGLKQGFYDNILDKLYKQLSKAKTNKERIEIEKAIKDAEGLNFVHIPSALWFDFKVNRDPVGSRRILSVLAKKRRKTFKIADLINDGIIKEKDISLTDVIMSYGRRLGKDIALLDFVNAAASEGLAIKAKRAIPKDAMVALKDLGSKPKEYLGMIPSEEQYVKAKGFVPAPSNATVLKNYYVHPYLRKWIEDFTNPQATGIIGRAWETGMATLKMAQFVNPIILPAYDIIQSAWLGSVKNPIGFIKYLDKGVKSVLAKDSDYETAYKNGLFSKPFANPMTSYMKEIDRVKKDFRVTAKQTIENLKEDFKSSERKTIGDLLDRYGDVLEALFPLKWVESAYNGSWYVAWFLDEGVRMADYLYLKDKGMSARDAAQQAAKYHGDYAGVPTRTRRALNKVMFTPTFKIAMGKLQIEMLRKSIDYAGAKLQGKSVDDNTARLAKGVLYGAAILFGFHIFMTSMLGFETEDWGWKYRKNVDTDEGPKDLVIGWTNPVNTWLKFVHRFNNATEPGKREALKTILVGNKGEWHPAYQLMYELASNRSSRGGVIFAENDSDTDKAIKSLSYSVNRLVPILSQFNSDKRSEDSKQKMIEVLGSVTTYAMRPITFEYLKTSREVELINRIKTIQTSLNDDITRAVREGESLDDIQKWVDNANKEINAISKMLQSEQAPQ